MLDNAAQLFKVTTVKVKWKKVRNVWENSRRAIAREAKQCLKVLFCPTRVHPEVLNIIR